MACSRRTAGQSCKETLAAQGFSLASPRRRKVRFTSAAFSPTAKKPRLFYYGVNSQFAIVALRRARGAAILAPCAVPSFYPSLVAGRKLYKNSGGGGGGGSAKRSWRGLLGPSPSQKDPGMQASRDPFAKRRRPLRISANVSFCLRKKPGAIIYGLRRLSRKGAGRKHRSPPTFAREYSRALSTALGVCRNKKVFSAPEDAL